MMPAPLLQSPRRNAFTVDVEDYFQVSAFERHIPKQAWAAQPQRLELNMARVLGLLAEFGVTGTFFTLGWVAERYPAMVRQMVAAGHEVASHGYDHTRVTQFQPAQFQQDVTRAKHLLEDTSGSAVRGYRAPAFSFRKDNRWAYDILQATGHVYSSSVAPLNHDLYGIPEAPRVAYREACGMLEIPISTVRLCGRNLPCGGGGFFRLYPYAVTRWCLRRINEHDQQAGIFYMHPWEIDAEQPRQRGIKLRTQIRHYLNLARVEGRLRRLLSEFRWGRMDEVFPV